MSEINETLVRTTLFLAGVAAICGGFLMAMRLVA